MTKEERELYHSDVKAKSDWNAGIRYAEKKARLEGKLEGKFEIAINLKKEGMSAELIAKTTGLSIEEVEKL
jgi:predicted transposase/invertase (TIGR01784 family)